MPQTFTQSKSAASSVIDPARIAVIIPTWNAAHDWPRLSAALRMQQVPANRVLIIDSSSIDGTRELAAREGYSIVCIKGSEFNHGGTRQRALESLPWAEFAVYLTQDAVLASPHAIQNLVSVFIAIYKIH